MSGSPVSLLRSFAKKTGINAYLAVLRDSPLRQQGWFRSYGDKPVDGEGNPLPWMPYSFIDFAEGRLAGTQRIFEYGSGNSTRWLANQAEEVVAVEHDEEWYEFIHSRTPSNTTIVQRDRPNYPDTIESFGEFDVVIIDGIRRVASVRTALGSLTEVGVIILDDADRPQYADAHDLLEERGFHHLTFRGMGPCTPNLQATSIYYRDENCFGI